VALVLVFESYGILHRGGVEPQLRAQLSNHLEWVGTRAVALVDEAEARHVVPLHLPVDCDGLALHASNAAQHENSAVEHAQCALHLDGEVDVPWRVNDVDLRVFPLAERRRGLDGDALFSFKFHANIFAPTPSFPLTSWMLRMRPV